MAEYHRFEPIAASPWTAKDPNRAPPVRRTEAGELLKADRAVEAEQVLGMATRRFPEALGVAVLHARIAESRGGWAEAAERWRIILKRDSVVSGPAARAAERTNKWLNAIGDHLSAEQQAIITDPGRLLWEFESLGENCELGLVQRFYGIEPITLMRWAASSYEHLMTALTTDFTGTGDFTNTELKLSSLNEYMLRDAATGMRMHTFKKKDDVERDAFHRSQARRLGYLVRKFREEAALGERIFVRTSPHPITDSQVRALHKALRRYGDMTLLYVRETLEPARVGMVEWMDGGIMLGFIGRRITGEWHIPHDTWLTVCRRAYAMKLTR